MLRSFAIAIAVSGTLGGSGPTLAAAQLNTVPFAYSPPPGPQRGLGTGTLFAARGVNDDSGEAWAFALGLELGVSDAVSVGGAVGTVQSLDPPSDHERNLQGALTAAVRLFRAVSADGSGSTSISVVAGLGYAPITVRASETNVPIGLGIARVIELGGLAVEAWTSPRFVARRVAFPDDHATQYGGALSAGANVGFSLGAALVAAVEYRTFGEKRRGALTVPVHSPLSAALGLRFRSGL